MKSQELLSTQRRLKRVAPLQFGKIMALVYGIMGLIFIPFFLLMSLGTAHLPPAQRVGILAVGTGFAIFAPIIYAVMGFVVGVIGAAIYNLVAKWIGGIVIEVEWDRGES